MPPRGRPTVRQVRVGTELRRLREAAGMTAREVAQFLGSTSAQMSHIEAGIGGVSGERVRMLAAHYACTDTELVDALVEMATDRTRGWWEEYRDVLPPVFCDLAELQDRAVSLQEIATAHVPGLLQTEEYSRAVFTYWRPELPERDIELRVEHRLRRREVLGAVPYLAVLHESVLRTRVADGRVARAQLDTVLELSDKPGVTVRVIPFDVDGFAGASAELLYMGGRVPALDTGQRDTAHDTAFVDAPAQLLAMRTLFRKVEAVALDPSRSRSYLHRIAKEL
ncbi:helix-turn-helix transcriptional regulator [Streptomyces prunicolor]|uniref:helix-turn-helix domain-containing protein n=1 Tax=Streptomyces prunicolor TaxID=67348 RepID=UPI002254F0B2|nr:helix-turn-helix transcriptional regulator [Streptomyces prunicolor]MCX5235851.1 helix-turn-helix transcriptional regulator [Streptomyces prunicolor]